MKGNSMHTTQSILGGVTVALGQLTKAVGILVEYLGAGIIDLGQDVKAGKPIGGLADVKEDRDEQVQNASSR